jgi:ferredoxin-NADP reductase
VPATAVRTELTWRPATVTQARSESPTTTTLRLAVEDWRGHRPGQHVDVRVTAADGYRAVRPYSVASAAGSGLLEITVADTPGGEVSPYLAHIAHTGHRVEVRGPLGQWFVWDPSSPHAVQLVAGGSGVVPLMSMLRTHRDVEHPAAMRLLYSVARPQSVLYGEELRALDATRSVHFLYTRLPSHTDGIGAGRRITRADLSVHALPADTRPQCFVCGPTGFVETVLDLLAQLGHDPGAIRAERYG